MANPDLHKELRHAVGELCTTFPDAYWRDLDSKRAYPEDFVQALTRAGYLATLVPEEYGGAGVAEAIAMATDSLTSSAVS